MTHQSPGRGFDRIISGALRHLHCALTRNTTIVHISPSVFQLTGHAPESLIGLQMLLLVHPHDSSVFFDELWQAAARPGSVFRFHARLRTAYADPSHAAFELCGHFHPEQPSSSNSTGTGNGIFTLTARPAFLPSSAQMDAFLELTMEEQALRRQLATLRAEEGDDAADGDDDDDYNNNKHDEPPTKRRFRVPSTNSGSLNDDDIRGADVDGDGMTATSDIGIPFVHKQQFRPSTPCPKS
ncbi:hypothetical protein SLS58_008570 [Diplodia intermedia]|uniref:PAS domain-containing protein n=1 Tax=Diplodia intermedia TaxID=856260 RepID=A0ABR3TH47_9PEZI